MLILVQKLLKLVKVDRFFRHKGTHQLIGTWLLLVPGAVAVVVVSVKLGWVGGALLALALLFGLIGAEGKPHPRIRKLFRR